MRKIVAIRFREAGKIYHFSPNSLPLHIGDAVIVETSQGVDLGYVAEEVFEVPDDLIREPLRGVTRMADDEDLMRYAEKTALEDEAFTACREKIEQHKLEMNLVETESSLDGRKLVFYFTADGRVDFRELVKDLAAVFRTRIELRQIGVRDQARMVGGLGLCGRELCCCSFLTEFVPVSIKMAKTQGLSMNPSKISGACGRLMCCLKYEQEAYEDAHSRLPDQGDIVSCPEGRGVIQSVDYLRETARVYLEKDDSHDILVFPCSEIQVIVAKKKKKQPAANAAAQNCDSCKSKKGKGCGKNPRQKQEEVSFVSGDPVEYVSELVATEKPEFLENDLLT